MIRKMRGGAQAHLLETEEGFYVVKFLSNPQHRRILANEWIASVILRYLQIAAPPTALIEITDTFLRENPQVSLRIGNREIPIEPGWHFGSRYPGDPAVTAVYDYVPDALLNQVVNRADFLACLVFDKWMANADGRQCIFFRSQIKDWISGSTAHARKMGFVALMIDHGFVFNGPHWEFPESVIQGLYSRHVVYQQVTSLDSFQPWLDRVIYFPEHIVDEAFRQIPPQWVEGEADQLEAVLTKLLQRCRRLPDLLSDARQAKGNPFPNWK